MKEINERNCKRLTGFKLSELIEVTGILGVRSHFDYKRAKKFIAAQSPINTVLEITTSDGLIELVVYIDKKTLTIVNDIINVNIQGTNAGLKLLESQVFHAMKHNFKELHLIASGGKQFPKDNGHITWAKVGYTMDSPAKRRFKKEIQIACNRKEKDLLSLLATKGGQRVWERKGFPWGGIFRLSNQSQNMRILKSALKRKFS